MSQAQQPHVMMLTATQTRGLHAYLKNALGIEQPADGTLVILSDVNRTVAFPSDHGQMVSDVVRLKGHIRSARQHGDDELADMVQHTLANILSPVDDLDCPL